MPTKHAHCVRHVVLLVTACVLLMSVPATGLCEERCEMANPTLHRLKSVWSRLYTSKTANFDSFVQSTLEAAGRRRRIAALRNTMIRMMWEYRDCIMSCEHAFSKRSYRQTNDNSRTSKLCHLLSRTYAKSHQVTPTAIIRYCYPLVP